MIERTGGKFVVKSKTGKRLSRPLSESAAVRRLRQVEYFKNKGGKDDGNHKRKR